MLAAEVDAVGQRGAILRDARRLLSVLENIQKSEFESGRGVGRVDAGGRAGGRMGRWADGEVGARVDAVDGWVGGRADGEVIGARTVGRRPLRERLES